MIYNNFELRTRKHLSTDVCRIICAKDMVRNQLAVSIEVSDMMVGKFMCLLRSETLRLHIKSIVPCLSQ